MERPSQGDGDAERLHEPAPSPHVAAERLDDGPGEPLPRAAGPTPDTGRSRTKEAVLVAIAGAVATAIVTALLSGSTWRSITSMFGDTDSGSGSDGESSTQTAGDEPDLPLKTLSTSNGAIALRVPESWGSLERAWDVYFESAVDPGLALSTGTGAALTTPNAWDAERFYFTASSAAAERLGMKGRSEQELADYMLTLTRDLDWSGLAGCTFVRETPLGRTDYVSARRVWSGCRGFADMDFHEFFAASPSGDVLILGQLVTSELEEADQETLLEEWAVRAESLPTGPPTPVEDVDDSPLPPWYDDGVGGDHAGTP